MGEGCSCCLSTAYPTAVRFSKVAYYVATAFEHQPLPVWKGCMRILSFGVLEYLQPDINLYFLIARIFFTSCNAKVDDGHSRRLR